MKLFGWKKNADNIHQEIINKPIIQNNNRMSEFEEMLRRQQEQMKQMEEEARKRRERFLLEQQEEEKRYQEQKRQRELKSLEAQNKFNQSLIDMNKKHESKIKEIDSEKQKQQE